MDPNTKGVLGHLKIQQDLIRQGFYVYSEVNKNSKVDLVILDSNYKPFKIQVKCTTSINGVAKLPVRKCCLNSKYNSTYNDTQVDIFALYVEDTDQVFYVSAQEALKNKNQFNIRLTEAKNGQKSVNNSCNYLKVPV